MTSSLLDNVINFHKMNVLMVGDTMTGKTALTQKYVYNTIKPELTSTIGIEYENKVIINHNKCDGAQISIAIWDTAGQKIFRSLIKHYYKNADAVVIVFDLTNINSFNNIKYWIKETEKLRLDGVPFYIVGNKLDLHKNVVSKNDVELIINEYLYEYDNIKYFETSALLGFNVTKLFNSIIYKVLEKNGIISVKSGLNIKNSLKFNICKFFKNKFSCKLCC